MYLLIGGYNPHNVSTFYYLSLVKKIYDIKLIHD